MRPVEQDADGVVRFKGNRIVRYMLDMGGIDLNHLVRVETYARFTQEDWEEFYQLIGYSVSGYHELSLVSDDSALEAGKLRDALLGPPTPQTPSERNP